jgi:serine phosphatase RsbU (regulator of sigma subunit)/ligand-binding sensor domain-containing protein
MFFLFSHLNNSIVKKLFLFSVLLTLFSAVQSQFLRQPISNFTPTEYGQTYSTYTLAVAEDENGMIYLGTAYGVLQYDGTSWRFIPVKSGVYITSLAVHNNTVYVGSQGEFGYLKPNEQGKLQYQSLSEGLPPEEASFTRVWNTLVWNQSVVFQAEEKLFVYRNDSITIVKPVNTFHRAFVEGNDLFIRERNTGLLQFDGKKFSLVPDGNIFWEIGIFAILPFEDNTRLVVTMEKGLWKWDSKKFTRVSKGKEFDTRLANAEVVGGIALTDGNYAIKTLKNGILILDKSFNIIAEYSDNNGMISSEVIDLLQDKYGNLWSATRRGASRLLYPCPYSFYNQSSGLYGIVQAIGKRGHNLLIGTSVGLFINHPVGMKAFEEVSAMKGSGSIWSIEESPKGQWIGAEYGLWFFDGNNYELISNRHTSNIIHVPNQGWIVAAGSKGIQIFDSNTKELLQSINDISGDLYGLAYNYADNNRVIEFWIGTKTSKVWQLQIKPDLSFTYDLFIGSDDGLPSDWICPHRVGEKVVFATSGGMLRFIHPEEIYALLNDKTIAISDLRGYFDWVYFPKNSSGKSITALYIDKTESYAAMDYNVFSVSMSDSISNGYNYKTLKLGRFNTIKKWNNQLYVGGDGGLAIVEQKKFADSCYAIPNLLLRSIAMGYDSIIWHGDIPLEGKSFVIPYSMNTLNIDVSSNYIDNEQGAQYSWILNGSDKGYTRWSPQGKILLSNLMEGDYVLSIVAKNIHDELGNEIKLSFKVLPPWYRTWLAYTLYIVAAIGLVYFIIQLNIRRLKAQNRRLEEIVKLRTKEVVEQKEHIEHILEDIRSSINYAQRIQQALLPSQELIKEYLPKHFIIFKPRDVVSGDFYWAAKINQWVIITVVDCTGHGVPGAFMSMLGISFLHEIVRKHEVVNAAMVLNELRKAVIDALKQTGKQNEQKDGMDMSLAAINLETRKCLWAGANNSVYIVRKNGNAFADQPHDERKHKFFTYDKCSLYEIKADKMPVAIHTVMDEYTNHEIELLEGDRLFLFTDGFADQFGGPEYRKFMAKSFKELIATTSLLPIEKQGKAMEKAFKAWIDESEDDVEQIDDVTVMGIEV